MTSTVHDFDERRRWSETQAARPWWGEVYREAFPDIDTCEIVTDLAQQRAGVDRVITLRNGRTITVDEKVRGEHYPDVLLEVWSDVDRQTPGWVQDTGKVCEYLAYAFEPSGVCYLLPYLSLRRAWFENADEWTARYGTRVARSRVRSGRQWSTENVPVPTEVLIAAVADQITVRFSPPASWDQLPGRRFGDAAADPTVSHLIPPGSATWHPEQLVVVDRDGGKVVMRRVPPFLPQSVHVAVSRPSGARVVPGSQPGVRGA